MRIRVFKTAPSAARSLARQIANAVRASPDLVLGLPTGRTPIPLYAALVALSRRKAISFARATTFNVDEFLGVAAHDPRSYHTYMARHLFDQVDIDPRRTHFLNGLPRDAAAECARYERAIRRAGGLDLLILGLGVNGHIGFNEPGTSLVARTHRVRLSSSTRRANAALFGTRVGDVPTEGLSMGIATILAARRIVLLVAGTRKAVAVERLLDGPVTPRVPASLLQLHPNADIWLDRDAGSRLRSA